MSQTNTNTNNNSQNRNRNSRRGGRGPGGRAAVITVTITETNWSQPRSVLVTLWISCGHPARNKCAGYLFEFHLSITLAVIWICRTVTSPKNWIWLNFLRYSKYWNTNSSTTSNTLDFLWTPSAHQPRRLFVWISFINHSRCDLNIQDRCQY